MSKTPEPAKQPEPPVHYYHLDFVVKELGESAKSVNSRTYSCTVSTARNEGLGSHRVHYPDSDQARFERKRNVDYPVPIPGCRRQSRCERSARVGNLAVRLGAVVSGVVPLLISATQTALSIQRNTKILGTPQS